MIFRIDKAVLIMTSFVVFFQSMKLAVFFFRTTFQWLLWATTEAEQQDRSTSWLYVEALFATAVPCLWSLWHSGRASHPQVESYYYYFKTGVFISSYFAAIYSAVCDVRGCRQRLIFVCIGFAQYFQRGWIPPYPLGWCSFEQVSQKGKCKVPWAVIDTGLRM